MIAYAINTQHNIYIFSFNVKRNCWHSINLHVHIFQCSYKIQDASMQSAAPQGRQQLTLQAQH